MNYFITAIGTDSGKTLTAAIFCEALEADYWKPVQSGLPRDTDTVRNLISNPHTTLHPEQYLLKTPVSPHAAAKIDGVDIRLPDFHLPPAQNNVIIEGAGGCLVPLNDRDLMIDLLASLQAPAIIVSNHYLGSINHTLLTVEALRRRNLEVAGIVFNGEPNEETETVILRQTNLDCLLRIHREPLIDAAVVRRYAELLKSKWNG